MPLTNDDYNDRELLLVIRTVSGSDGLASSEDIAQELGFRPGEGRSLASVVSSRLSWMASCGPNCAKDCQRHYGYLERVDPKSMGVDDVKTLWRITDLGNDIALGQLSRDAERLLSDARTGTQVLIMRDLTRAAFGGRFGQSSAVRREFQHQASRRRRGL